MFTPYAVIIHYRNGDSKTLTILSNVPNEFCIDLKRSVVICSYLSEAINRAEADGIEDIERFTVYEEVQNAL
jgi:hypothetical protein